MPPKRPGSRAKTTMPSALICDNRTTVEHGGPRRVLRTLPGRGRSAKEIDVDERTCSIEGCDRPQRGRGWCNVHYCRWYRNGDPEYQAPPREKDVCSVDGCSRHVSGRGWCATHYLRWWKKSDPGSAVIQKYNEKRLPCTFEGCSNVSSGRGLCSGHWRQDIKGRQLRPLQRRTDPRARDAAGYKYCGTCDSWLPVGHFTRAVDRADGLSARCSRCERSQSLKRKYGITLDDYEKTLAGQGGGCAVCRKTEAINGRRLAVDHDHGCCPGRITCGRCVRGLLCSSCNLHLGAIGDNLDHVEAMATYLRAAHGRAG